MIDRNGAPALSSRGSPVRAPRTQAPAPDDPVSLVAAGLGEAFALPHPALEVCRYGNGHVNDTFLAIYETDHGRERYVHQRLAAIFENPGKLMENIVRVTRHLRDRMLALGIADVERRCLTVVPTSTGSWWHQDGDSRAWRTYRFVEGATSIEEAAGPEEIREAGRAFGEMTALLADLGGPPLNETIHRFHDLPRRFTQLREACAADVAGRAATAAHEVGLAISLEGIALRWSELAASRELPSRPVHNDTKLNNVLFDAPPDAPPDAPAGSPAPKAICVVDLDTTMPGWSICDFGDLVRTTVSPTPEDVEDPSRVRVEPERFAAALDGWLGACRHVLVGSEVEHLVFGAQAMATEVAVRFLADHLAGDRYFRVAYPGHNLVRSRAQLALARELVSRGPDLEKTVAARRGGHPR